MPIRTLIVDDSPTMQRLLKAVLEVDNEIEVVGLASDPHEARALIKQLNPDVLTLDVEMPRMNGIEFLKKIMSLRPMPVVMISNHTEHGADISIEVLELGAFCCLPKPRVDDEVALREIREMIYLANHASESIRSKVFSPSPKGPYTGAATVRHKNEPELIVIGSSTGGVEALTTVFSAFPDNCPPTVVVQHMPGIFTKAFAERLNRFCKPTVVEAQNRGALEWGHIYIAPGAIGHTKITKTDILRTRIVPDEPVDGHMPAVDVLLNSVPKDTCSKVSAAILTGMGKDGAKGLLRLKDLGAKTISQDRATSLVFGMPAAAIKMGAAQQTLPIKNIASALLGN